MKTDAERAAEKLALDLGLRNGLLFLHGSIGIEVGLTMLLTGGPSILEATQHGPDWRLGLGAWSILFGIITLYGLARGEDKRDGWTTLIIGLTGILIWELVLVGVFIWALTQTGLDFPHTSEHVNPTTGRLWVPFVYATLAGLLATHIAVLLRIGPPRK